MTIRMNLRVRAYRPEDEAGLLRSWNDGLFADQISTTTWRTKVLLDPNIDHQGCLVAEVDGDVQGFILSIVRRVPFFNQGLEPKSSWITAFAVALEAQGQGIGSVLLDAATERLRALGRTSVAISPYVPNYFTPGPDVNALHVLDGETRVGGEEVIVPLMTGLPAIISGL